MTGLQGWTNPVIACVLQRSASGLDSSILDTGAPGKGFAAGLRFAPALRRLLNSQQPNLTGSKGHLSSWEELALRAGSTQSLTGLISPSAACRGLRQQRKTQQSRLDHWFSHGPDPELLLICLHLPGAAQEEERSNGGSALGEVRSSGARRVERARSRELAEASEKRERGPKPSGGGREARKAREGRGCWLLRPGGPEGDQRSTLRLLTRSVS